MLSRANPVHELANEENRPLNLSSCSPQVHFPSGTASRRRGSASTADEAREPHVSMGLQRSLAGRASPARPCQSCRAARLPAPRSPAGSVCSLPHALAGAATPPAGAATLARRNRVRSSVARRSPAGHWLRALACLLPCALAGAAALARRCRRPPAPCALLRSTALARWAMALRAHVLAAACACRSRRAATLAHRCPHAHAQRQRTPEKVLAGSEGEVLGHFHALTHPWKEESRP